MTKVKFDSGYLEKNIYPKVKNARDYLKTAKKTAGNLSVPFDFKYYNYLKKLDNSLNDYVNDLDKFNKWINECKKEYNNLNKDYEEKLKKVDNFSIKKHNKI